ncbi:DUF3489 domain-containing protein, partial [Methylocella silvestris]
MSLSKPKPKIASPKARRAAAASPIAPVDAKVEAESAAKVSPSLKPAPRAGTKQDAVIAMLRRPQGATISAIMTATGWQQHSVRGFLAAVVRKKLGLTLASDKRGTRESTVSRRKTAGRPPRKRRAGRRRDDVFGLFRSRRVECRGRALS